VGTDAAALAEADFVIVAVPTPVDQAHQPDFGPLIGSSEAVGRNLKRGATVVFESTVYPGATEEVCIPIIEKHSGMKWKRTSLSVILPSGSTPATRSGR
jgi:UDP-N-acetyl-D-galactosamine dehydrogenase